jgi:hypothetical protein
MIDALWIAAAVVVALIAYQLRRLLRKKFGARLFGRLLGELTGWVGYFLAITLVLVKTNEGWQDGFPNVFGTRHHWSDTLPLALALGALMAVINLIRLERAGEISTSTGDESAFPTSYVNDILEAEGKASKDECKRMARALMRQQKRTKQALPEALVEFVGRHLDRTV